VATLHVRNIPEDLYKRLRSRAAAEHRSLSAEVIGLLESSLRERERGARADEALARLRDIARQNGPVPEGTAAALIREVREEE
jgi:plasmid stability protein